MKPLRWFLWRIGRFLLLLYFGLALTGWFVADHLIFQPQRPTYGKLPGLLNFNADDGTPLAGLCLPNPAARHTLVYLHGNAEDMGNCMPVLQAIHDIGFAVLAFDYRGYGLSAGHATEANVYADTHAFMAYARARLGVSASQCVIVGRSLGGGPAVELAASAPVAGLVLISAFSSAFRVSIPVKVLPFDRFDNLARIDAVKCPVLFIQGTADEVVPFAHGQALLAAATAPKRAVWIEGAGHNDIFDRAGDRILRELVAFETSLPAPLVRKP
jgi:fermentation-respiration switch protein FrsA (DUF1100 family)